MQASILSHIPGSAPKQLAHWPQGNKAFRHADRCPFDKNGSLLVPRDAGALKTLASGGQKNAWPSALKKVIAAMVATPKLLRTA